MSRKPTDQLINAGTAALEAAVQADNVFNLDTLTTAKTASSIVEAGARTLGEILLSEAVPKEVLPQRVITKKELLQTLYNYVKAHPEKGGEVVAKLDRLGHDFATHSGYSISIDDLEQPPEIKTIVEAGAARIIKETDPNKRQQLLLDLRKEIKDAVEKYGHKNRQFELVKSGARGTVEQYMRTFVTPVAAKAPIGVVPWYIKHGFSTGLRPSEYIATAVESRLNNVAAHFSITQPGDFSKVLVNTMADQLILGEDCKTTNGVSMRTSDPNIVDRFLAKSIGTFPAGTLITPDVATALRSKYETVVVRSPMTCELDEGVCQKCYGLSERGNLPTIGTNVGVRSAQAITEPLTQFALSSKHNVLKVQKAAHTSTIKELRQFLDVPKIFSGKAILATETGNITKIEKAPQGGSFIYIGEAKHYAPPAQDIIVRLGQHVYKGDALTTGVPPPNEVVKYKGLGPGRAYVVERLYDTFKNEGVDLDKRHFEILARSHLNYVQIVDDPHNRFLPGEIVKYHTFRKALRDPKEVPVEDAEGHFLYTTYLHYLAGTPVTKPVIEDLKRAGIKTVKIAQEAPKFSFFMPPVTNTPLLNPDWMARLGHRHLRQTLLQAAHMGETTDIHGAHPVPAYAYGIEFGKGKSGKY